MSKRFGRRQLLKGAAASLAGAAVGVTSVETAAAAMPEKSKPKAGIVARLSLNGEVVVRMDRPGTGRLLTARGSLLHRSLKVGDRVAVEAEPDGSLVASPIFVGLSGDIEKYADNQLTVLGRTCVIDEFSVVRDASGDRNVVTVSDPNVLAVGRAVGLLCVDNRKSGRLTLHTAYLEV